MLKSGEVINRMQRLVGYQQLEKLIYISIPHSIKKS